MLSPNGRKRKTQHQTRNGQLCSRSCTTQPRHILASQTENTRTGSTPTTRSYRLYSRRDQAHQRVLQTTSTRSTTAAYQDASRPLKKRTELQRVPDSNNMMGFYNGLKEVWEPKKKGPVQLNLTDGMEESCGKME